MVRAKWGWKPSHIVIAAVMVLSTLIPLLKAQPASAAILPEREIKMSSSANGATGVTYHVEFNIGTSTAIQGIVVDFCSNTPIIGDTTCTKTAGLVPDLNGAGSVTVSGQSSTAGGNLSTFTSATVGGTNDSQLTLNAASAVSMTAGTAAFFDITTVTNPTNVNTAFFARIYTFATDTASNAYTVASPGTYVDAGGIALSTAAQITVTAKVAERLVFCVYTTGDGNDCDNNAGSAINLGDTNGVLSPSGAFVNAFSTVAGADNDTGTRFSITTNASFNAIVRMTGTTLTSGSNTITANTAATASSPGNEQFGLCLYEQSGGAGNLSIDTLYDGDSAGNTSTACSGTTNTAGGGSTGGDNSAAFAFDSSGSGTTSLYGDEIATKPAGDFSTARLSFLGNISNTTEAGIYTTTLTFIATGTY